MLNSRPQSYEEFDAEMITAVGLKVWQNIHTITAKVKYITLWNKNKNAEFEWS